MFDEAPKRVVRLFSCGSSELECFW